MCADSTTAGKLIASSRKSSAVIGYQCSSRSSNKWEHLSSEFVCCDTRVRTATLRVHLVPNANSEKVVGEHGSAIKIKLRAPAVEGKANAALIRFLAKQLELPRRAIVLERGEKSRDKVIRVGNLSEEELYRRLLGAR
jgi:uncharacterized protein (TIGR00251 family)